FYNVYGPTEATGVSLTYRIRRLPASAEEEIPIGRACANMEALLLSDDLKPVPTGTTAEIWLRGSSISPGYWRDEGTTRERFVHNPCSGSPGDRLYRTGDLGFVDNNGDIHFVGRVDDQVKVMGYRVELGEIVHALQSLPEVGDAAALLVTDAMSGMDVLVG